jgi:hypothetical protein
VGLERYGHHHGILQTPASALNFFGRIPFTPYLRGVHPCHECTYNLGYARPGDCVRPGVDLPGWSSRGALYQSATVSSWILLIP